MNPVVVVSDALSYSFMRHAFLAAALVAVMAGTVGWFMVLRLQAYAGHTLSIITFPGATAAVYFGLPTLFGYFGACVAGAFALSALGRGSETTRQSAGIAVVQAVALAFGLLFVSLSTASLRTSTAYLFGSFTGVSVNDVLVLAVVTAAVVSTITLIARPLYFASIDRVVAQTQAIPVRLLSVVFLLTLGLAVAGTSRFTGALLVFALLVAPPAAAQQLTLRPGRSVILSVVFALLAATVGLFGSFASGWPVGFLVATAGFVTYLVARGVRLIADRRAV